MRDQSEFEKGYLKYQKSPRSIRAEQIFAEYAVRTDLNRVLIRAGTYDIHLHEQADEIGPCIEDGIVEIIGTFGVPVALVLETYRQMAGYIIPDDHLSVPWGAIAGRMDKPCRVHIEEWIEDQKLPPELVAEAKALEEEYDVLSSMDLNANTSIEIEQQAWNRQDEIQERLVQIAIDRRVLLERYDRKS